VDRVLGFLRLYQNNLSEAEQAFREAHRLDPDDPEPLHRLGELYGSQQKWDEAMAWWDQARRLDPTDACVRAHIGQAYAYRGEQAKAVAELKEAERFAAPEDLSVEQGIAWAYNVLGETTLAMEHYEKCVALARARGVDPDFVRRIEELVRQLKGSLTPTYVTASRPKVYTDETLEAALRERLTPEEIEGVVNPLASSPEIQRWAQELTQDGKDDLDKAKRIFDALLRHVPGKSGTRTAVEVFAAWNQPGESFNCQELAKLFVAMARDVGIQAFYVVVEKDYRGKPVPHACAAVFTEDQVLLVDPTYRWFGVPHQQFEVLDDLQSIAHQLSYSREVSSCRLAVKLYPDSVWTQMALAGALIGASQWEKTFVASILAWQPEPDLWNYFTQEAGKAQWEEARRAMEAVLRLEPDDWKAYYLQGAFAAYDGKPEEAAGYLRKALGLNPESTEAHFMLAWVLGIQGQLKEAREELRACLQHQPPSDVAEQAHRAIALINEQIGAE
jgi:tetratricopeptide (TPR) repeat protein